MANRKPLGKVSSKNLVRYDCNFYSVPEGYREFTSLLLLLKEYPLEEVTTALAEALSLRSLHTSTVRQILLGGENNTSSGNAALSSGIPHTSSGACNLRQS